MPTFKRFEIPMSPEILIPETFFKTSSVPTGLVSSISFEEIMTLEPSYLYEKLVAGEVTTTSDIKIELDFNLRSGKSIASRDGTSKKTKHIDIRLLWVQDVFKQQLNKSSRNKHNKKQHQRQQQRQQKQQSTINNNSKTS